MLGQNSGLTLLLANKFSKKYCLLFKNCFPCDFSLVHKLALNLTLLALNKIYSLFDLRKAETIYICYKQFSGGIRQFSMEGNKVNSLNLCHLPILHWNESLWASTFHKKTIYIYKNSRSTSSSVLTRLI